MPRAATIGVYGWTAERFMEALREADVRQLLDVRQRRGVRGPGIRVGQLPSAPSGDGRRGIDYRHHPELAPTTELRHLQYAEDDRLGVGKRSRTALAPEYVERYTREILDRVDLGPIVAEMPRAGRAALFCVERDPEACHRSLIAARLTEQHGVAGQAPAAVKAVPCPRYSEGASPARIAQLVEHFHGKEGVVGSSPTPGL